MKINNNTIEEIITVLNDPHCFRNNIEIKVPSQIRFAMRINETRLMELFKAYNEERQSIINQYIEKGYAENKDGQVKISSEHIDEINADLLELASYENDVNLETIDSSIVNSFIENQDLSIPEEKLILFFVS